MNNYADMFREICKLCLCDNCKMYNACKEYNGLFSHYPEEVANKIIEEMRDHGTKVELKVLEEYGLNFLKME